MRIETLLLCWRRKCSQRAEQRRRLPHMPGRVDGSRVVLGDEGYRRGWLASACMAPYSSWIVCPSPGWNVGLQILM